MLYSFGEPSEKSKAVSEKVIAEGAMEKTDREEMIEVECPSCRGRGRTPCGHKLLGKTRP